MNQLQYQQVRVSAAVTRDQHCSRYTGDTLMYFPGFQNKS